MCSHSAPESTAAYKVLSSSYRSGNFKTPFSWAGLGKKCACTIPDSENMQIPSTHGAPFSSLLSRNGSCLPLQNILGLEVDGMDQAAAYRTGRSTPSCAHETANACVREHSRSTLPRRLSLPGLIVMTFQRLSSRRIQSSRPSETFACPA